jgi:hypothetical protein
VDPETISDNASFATPRGIPKLTLLSVTIPPVSTVLVGIGTEVSIGWVGVATDGRLHETIKSIIVQRMNSFCFINILSSIGIGDVLTLEIGVVFRM